MQIDTGKLIGEGINIFRVKINPDNDASQCLFEKMGAVTYCIAEYLLYEKDDIEHFEEGCLRSVLVCLCRK